MMCNAFLRTITQDLTHVSSLSRQLRFRIRTQFFIPTNKSNKLYFYILLQIAVCGGDGTVGWVLSQIDAVTWASHPPPVAIIPLGTGNDLSRSLHWGGRYKDKPIKKVLHDVEVSNIEKLDRWKLSVRMREGVEKHPKATDEIPDSLTVFNNYFSMGIDAHIALQFHNARNANSDKFTSRTRNLLFYGLEGGKDLVVHKWRHLMDNVR